MIAARKAAAIAVLAGLALAFVLACFARPAVAQPAGETGDAPAQVQQPAPQAPQGYVSGHTIHEDKYESHETGMALLFWAFAAATVGGALFVITRRNLIAAVMGMVGSFLGIAAVYMMLYASFLAVLQMLVYAGAIMVLFVFVIMILNRPEDEPVAPTGRAGTALGALSILYIVGRLAMLLMHVHPPAGEAAVEAARKQLDDTRSVIAGIKDSPDAARHRELAEANEAAAELQYAKVASLSVPPPTREGYEWGSVRAVGTDLFDGGLFPFEAISILLLVAVVGAIAIARPLKDDTTGHAGELP
jgi:NADH:ubiquinone oxidoreductase subunit 6 (subunit J)|nr:NADH-quinone oxidoreductase subunit J [Kofleriaceae bacterium]